MHFISSEGEHFSPMYCTVHAPYPAQAIMWWKCQPPSIRGKGRGISGSRNQYGIWTGNFGKEKKKRRETKWEMIKYEAMVSSPQSPFLPSSLPFRMSPKCTQLLQLHTTASQLSSRPSPPCGTENNSSTSLAVRFDVGCTSALISTKRAGPVTIQPKSHPPSKNKKPIPRKTVWVAGELAWQQ